uniref:Uncharacterized protein n=1 Tax=Panagrolaimus davidi TaxID=227884 RepID=A0A914Q7J7_9BILA
MSKPKHSHEPLPSNETEFLNEETIPPVPFLDLFRFGNFWDKIYVAVGIFFGIFAGTAIVLPFFFSARLANALILKQNDTKSDELIEIGIFYICIDLGFGAIIFVSIFLQYYLLKVSCANITATLRKMFMKSLLEQDAAWLSQQRFGAINAQLTQNIDTIRDGLGEKLGSVIRGVSSFFAAIVLSFIADWQLALIPLVTGPMACALALYMTKLVNKAEAKQQKYIEKSGAILQESIMNVSTVQCCNGEEQMIEKYRKTLKEGRAHAVKTYGWSGFFDGLTFCILYFFFAADFCVGALFYFYGRIKQPGEVFIVPNTFFNGAWTLGTVSPYFVAIVKARVAAAHIYQKIDRKPLFQITDDDEIPTGGEIEFQNVYFSYPNRKSKPVLNGLSFKAEAGKVTALVSHSGGGKSTSVQLLMRVYTTDKGAVLINGSDIKKLKLAKLRRLIGVVQQEPVLFNETVFENIRLGDETISDKMIENACRIANAHSFIQKLSHDYDTKIGPGQIQLSGGQKQRLAIARAIVHNPPILLLDEATSALDAESERIVQAALKKAAKGRTTIVIAHRLSTLNDFVDKIVVIDNGVVIEEGTHKELTSKKDGFYSRLVKAQKIEGVLSKGIKSSQETDDANVEQLEDDEINERHVRYPEEDHIHENPLENMPLIQEVPRNVKVSQLMYMPIADGYAITHAHVKFHHAEMPASKQQHGLSLLYKNCHGNYGKLIPAIFVSALVGLELFFLVLLQGFMFDTMSSMSPLKWLDYRNNVIIFTVCAVGLGIFCFFTIAGSYVSYGWSAERIVDKLKVRAFSSILVKDAAYFDKPETGKAKLLSNISTNADSLKPVITKVFIK